MARRVTKESLVEALRKMRGDKSTSDDAMTAAEISKILGIKRGAVYHLLDLLGDEIEVVWVRRPTRTGIMQQLPAYTLKGSRNDTTNHP